MKIGIIGANGKVGSLVLKEAIARGYKVTAIVRNASKLTDKNIDVMKSATRHRLMPILDKTSWCMTSKVFMVPVGFFISSLDKVS